MKNLKKNAHFLVSPYFIGIVLTLLATYTAWNYYKHQDDDSQQTSSINAFIQQIHEKTIDWRLRARGPRPGNAQVAILTIDDKAVEQEGRWPWPRSKTAAVVQKTLDYGARLVAFDIVFSEADNNALSSLLRVKQELGNRVSSDALSTLDSEITAANTDQVFATTVAKYGDKLVLGSYFDQGYDANYQSDAAQDTCMQILLKKNPHYSSIWQASQLVTVDSDEFNFRLPDPLPERLEQYFARLEIKETEKWLTLHPSLQADLQKNLNEVVPAELLPPLIYFSITNDIENLKALVSEALGDSVAPETIKTAIMASLPYKEKAILTTAMRESSDLYCTRFLSPSDELTSTELYQKRWGEIESFAVFGIPQIWPEVQASTAKLAGISHEQWIQDMRLGLPNMVPLISRLWTNIPLLSQVTKHTGFFNAKLDTDGTIRRSSLFVRRGYSYLPSIALKSFLVANDATGIINIGTSEFGTERVVKKFDIQDSDGNTLLSIPVDSHGQLAINFAGSEHMFPHVSAADVLGASETIPVLQKNINPKNGRYEDQILNVNRREFLKDKILFFGATSTGIYDLRVTPFEENYPGVETHANVLSNLLTEMQKLKSGASTPAEAPGYLRKYPLEERDMLIVVLVLGLTLTLLLAHFSSIPGLLLTLCTLAGVYYFDKLYMFKSGYVITIFFPMTLISGLFVVLTFYKYFGEERKKRELKGTFEKYVSPSIVAEVLSDPSKIELGGRKMPLTVFFSDVRGFTTISEKLDPRALSDLLNSYLTPMTNLVFEHKGTLDKYMGDAIMAFFGAPIAYPDHAHHACRCALAHIEKLKELQRELEAKGLPQIDIGIGLNTGEVSVGNMGSNTVRNYTVMGDAVNLGSRLEGITKQYGTRIIISEFTKAAIGDDFITREVDWVRVKGKNLPVKIYELVGEKNVEPVRLELIKAFKEGFELYHQKQWQNAIAAFEKGLALQPTDLATQLYIDRCRDYLVEAPPDDWDGVYTMKTK